LTYTYPHTPGDPRLYVQTSPEVPVIARDVRGALASGEAGRVVIHTEQSMTWPWAWYIRGEEVLYVDSDDIHPDILRPTDIVISSRGHVARRPDVAEWYQEVLPYRHRWWFPEGGYRATTVDGLLGQLRDGTLLEQWSHFLMHRGAVEHLGALQAEIYFPKNATVNSRDRASDE